MHQVPNFEGNFEICCVGNAFPFLSEVYECLGPKNVVLHRPSVYFGLGTVSCGRPNALLPSGHNV